MCERKGSSAASNSFFMVRSQEEDPTILDQFHAFLLGFRVV